MCDDDGDDDDDDDHAFIAWELNKNVIVPHSQHNNNNKVDEVSTTKISLLFYALERACSMHA